MILNYYYVQPCCTLSKFQLSFGIHEMKTGHAKISKIVTLVATSLPFSRTTSGILINYYVQQCYTPSRFQLLFGVHIMKVGRVKMSNNATLVETPLQLFEKLSVILMNYYLHLNCYLAFTR